MISQYTMTLKEYIENGGELYTEKFALIPNFTLNNLNLNLYDMFVEDNAYKEIGAETEQMFAYYLNAKLDEVVTEYVPKITMYISHFDKLLDRTVELTRKETENYDETGNGENKNKNYLNPSTVNEDNSTIEDMSKQNTSFANNRDRKIDEARTVSFSSFTSNPEIMRQAMVLQNIYVECLRKFDVLFMGVL